MQQAAEKIAYFNVIPDIKIREERKKRIFRKIKKFVDQQIKELEAREEENSRLKKQLNLVCG